MAIPLSSRRRNPERLRERTPHAACRWPRRLPHLARLQPRHVVGTSRWRGRSPTATQIATLSRASCRCSSTAPSARRGSRPMPRRRSGGNPALGRRDQAAAPERDGAAAGAAAARAPGELRRTLCHRQLGKTSYGTAGHLGNGYFITVKHAVVALRTTRPAGQRKIGPIKIVHRGKEMPARLDRRGRRRQSKSTRGDWAIIKTKRPRPAGAARRHRLRLRFRRADLPPRQRLLKGHHPLTGYVGQRTANGLVTCLTDGHPGVSGGGVLEPGRRPRRHPDRPDARCRSCSGGHARTGSTGSWRSCHALRWARRASSRRSRCTAS